MYFSPPHVRAHSKSIAYKKACALFLISNLFCQLLLKTWGCCLASAKFLTNFSLVLLIKKRVASERKLNIQTDELSAVTRDVTISTITPITKIFLIFIHTIIYIIPPYLHLKIRNYQVKLFTSKTDIFFKTYVNIEENST